MDYRIVIVCPDVNACDCTQGCTDTKRESALKVDSRKKIPFHAGESNLHQQCDGRMLQPTELHPTQSFEAFFCWALHLYWICCYLLLCVCMCHSVHAWVRLFQLCGAMNVIYLAPLCTLLAQKGGWSHLLAAASLRGNRLGRGRQRLGTEADFVSGYWYCTNFYPHVYIFCTQVNLSFSNYLFENNNI